MDNNTKTLRSYSTIANWYDEHRARDLYEKVWLDLAIENIPPNSHVLDLGCGMG